ncbi:hypothetical protein GCM10010519_59000 [Streptomyces lactacystinicus]
MPPGIGQEPPIPVRMVRLPPAARFRRFVPLAGLRQPPGLDSPPQRPDARALPMEVPGVRCACAVRQLTLTALQVAATALYSALLAPYRSAAALRVPVRAPA